MTRKLNKKEVTINLLHEHTCDKCMLYTMVEGLYCCLIRFRNDGNDENNLPKEKTCPRWVGNKNDKKTN